MADDRKQELKNELTNLQDQWKYLAQANADLWNAVFVEGSRSHSDSFPRIIQNYNEIAKLGERGKEIAAEVANLEKKD